MKPKSAAAATPRQEHEPQTAPKKRRPAGPLEHVPELSVVAANGTGPVGALSEREQAGFEECEEIIDHGLSTFYEVGSALLRIQEGRWYRSSYPSFGEYCRERWSIGRAYAYRVLGAAERVKLLPGDEPLPKPENEFQMRPFLKLEPEVFPGAWKKVVKTAKGGKITAGMVRAVIRDLLPEDGDSKKKMRNKKIPVGQCLALLNEAKHHAEKGETDAVLLALDRIENLLVRA